MSDVSQWHVTHSSPLGDSERPKNERLILFHERKKDTFFYTAFVLSTNI